MEKKKITLANRFKDLSILMALLDLPLYLINNYIYDKSGKFKSMNFKLYKGTSDKHGKLSVPFAEFSVDKKGNAKGYEDVLEVLRIALYAKEHKPEGANSIIGDHLDIAILSKMLNNKIKVPKISK